MTDDNAETPAEEPAADAAPVATATVEPAAALPEPVSFWRRPNVERYLLPLITPIIVVLGIVIWVLNMSRIFLSAHGHVPVVVGSIITIVLLAGATLISNARNIRSQSVVLTTCGFIIIAIGAGWLVLGHSEVKNAGGGSLAATGPCIGTINVTALPSIKFTPVSIQAKTGIYCVTLIAQSGPHTLDFDDPSTLFPGLQVAQAGDKVSGRIFFGKAGDFTYFCAIPGHRATMNGVVHVTGNPTTVADAEAAAAKSGGGTSGASGASGATGATGSSG